MLIIWASFVISTMCFGLEALITLLEFLVVNYNNK